MSVFGGDSWAWEAHHRKRRVDDLLSASVPLSSYRKLSNGKLVCLVCPNTPVLDSPLALSVHCKGSRHAAAQSRLRERELCAWAQADKRIALSEMPEVDRKGKAPPEPTRDAAATTAASGGGGICGGEVDEEEQRRRREMELKFTSAGWRRDCHGKWFRDENAEFDSDEEDPNSYFS